MFFEEENLMPALYDWTNINPISGFESCSMDRFTIYKLTIYRKRLWVTDLPSITSSMNTLRNMAFVKKKEELNRCKKKITGELAPP